MTDVFLLTVDSLRTDYFTSEYFPHCWETFCKEFAVFENAYSNGVATPFSFPTIVTGNHSEPDGSLREDYRTIAELYDGQTWALTNNPHLRASRGYARGFDFFADNVNQIGTGGTSFGLVRKAKSLGASIPLIKRVYNWFRGTTGVDFVPQSGHAEDISSQLLHAMEDHHGLFWAHFMDPHYPFKPDKIPDEDAGVPETGGEIDESNERFKRGEATESDLELLRTLYGETIRYLDRSLAELFEEIQAAGRWEDSLIILVSDHGESFGEKGVYNHMWDADPIDSLVRVPLLLKFPGGTGRTYTHLVQNADLIATLSERLDWEISLPRSKPLTDDSSRIVVSKSNSAVRVTTPSGYAIRRHDGSTIARDSLNEEAVSVLNDTDIPRISKSDNQRSGEDTEGRDELHERLEYLGYK